MRQRQSQQHKLFQALNTIVYKYSQKTITSQSLDCHLTLQVVLGCGLDLTMFGFEKGVLAALGKILGTKADDEPMLGSFDIIIIHEYGKKANRNMNRHRQPTNHPLLLSLLQNIDNIIVMDGHGCIWNNILHYQLSCSGLPSNCNGRKYEHPPTPYCLNIQIDEQVWRQSQGFCQLNRPMFVILLNQSRSKTRRQRDECHSQITISNQILTQNNCNIKNSKSTNTSTIGTQISQQPPSQSQIPRSIAQLLEQYLQIIQLYHSHINLRLVAYPELPSLKQLPSLRKFQQWFTNVVQYCNSQDDLDVLIREQIPQNAFIKVCQQRANRVGRIDIKNNQQFVMVAEGDNWYQFRILQKSELDSKFIDPIKADDQFIIWVLINGLPILQTLTIASKPLNSIYNKKIPYLNQKTRNIGCKQLQDKNSNAKRRKLKIGDKNDKFQQIKSMLGCSRIVMKNKFFAPNIVQENQKSDGQIFSTHQTQYDHDHENDNDNSSIENCNSQYSCQSNASQGQQKAQKQAPSTYIINITEPTSKCTIPWSISQDRLDKIVSQQYCTILLQFLQKRKQLYQNLEINKNIRLIKRTSQLIQVQQRHLWFVLFVQKL